MGLPAQTTWPLPAALEGRAMPDGLAALPPSEGHQALLSWALSSMAAAERRVAELEARLAYVEGLTVTDELTRLLNRRGFLAELKRALETAHAGGPAGALMICDLDGFKAVNDRHGHNAGNRVLRELSAGLVRQVRRTDAVARLGGDEFGLLLPETGASDAEQLLARLRAAILAAMVRGGWSVGVSIGAATFRTAPGSVDEMMARADELMYAAKREQKGSIRLGAFTGIGVEPGESAALPP